MLGANIILTAGSAAGSALPCCPLLTPMTWLCPLHLLHCQCSPRGCHGPSCAKFSRPFPYLTGSLQHLTGLITPSFLNRTSLALRRLVSSYLCGFSYRCPVQAFPLAPCTVGFLRVLSWALWRNPSMLMALTLSRN